MRASYIKDIEFRPGLEISIEDTAAHHLINVVRIRDQEKVLLLNGQGLSAEAQVIGIKKKDLTLKVLNIQAHSRTHQIDLAISVVKKEALEDILKMAVELGCRKIYLLQTEFSNPLALVTERTEKILISAIEQSNNPYLPELIGPISFGKVNFLEYQGVYCFHPARGKAASMKEVDIALPQLAVIGPEAGFSEVDLAILAPLKHLQFVSLPTPILRATTAVPAALGWMCGRKS